MPTAWQIRSDIARTSMECTWCGQVQTTGSLEAYVVIAGAAARIAGGILIGDIEAQYLQALGRCI